MPLNEHYAASCFLVGDKLVPVVIHSRKESVRASRGHGEDFFALEFNGTRLEPRPGDVFLFKPYGLNMIAILGNLGCDEFIASESDLRKALIHMLERAGYNHTSSSELTTENYTLPESEPLHRSFSGGQDI